MGWFLKFAASFAVSLTLAAAPAHALMPADGVPAEQAMFADSHAPGMIVVVVKGGAETIRGYGHVKDRHLVKVRARWTQLLAAWRAGAAGIARAA